jgi:2,3-diketo-5-methylthio-1-phosphopentane phosphatase
MKYSDLWAEGKIGTREEIESTFQYIHASRKEMEEGLDTIAIIPGFKEFYDYCRTMGFELIIVSDSLEWAIRYKLAKIGIEEIKVMANQITFEDKGFHFSFPYFSPASPKYGVCKLDVAQKYKKEGRKVYQIGDGRTDFEATQAAEFIFARDALWDYCRENHLLSFKYDDFFDILGYIRDPANRI